MRTQQDNTCNQQVEWAAGLGGEKQRVTYFLLTILFKQVLSAFSSLSLEDSIDVWSLSAISVLLSGGKTL